MGPERHLVVFARWPRFGIGKRRLAKDIGEIETFRFQRTMLTSTLQRVGRDRRWTTWLAITPDRSGPWPARYRTYPQGTGDLGCRMATVMRRLPPGPIIIIGSDIPGISAAMIARAFRHLGSCKAVFGPAPDGGYWLVGLGRRSRAIVPFSGVRWSSEHALADTISNLKGAPARLVNSLEDIDDGQAFRRYHCCD